MITKAIILPLLLAIPSLALPAPEPVPCRRGDPLDPRGCLAFELQPSAIVVHDVWWAGQNVCNPGTCKVTKSPTSGGHDLTTMFTFTYPAAVANRQCWLEFSVPAGASVSAGAKVDVFRQWRPVSACPSQGNNRDVQLGKMVVGAAGGRATWEATYNSYLTAKGPCAAPGTVEGIEIVAVGDAEEVLWQQGAGVGVKVVYA
ncbi:hypothetical protein B0T22DRAFT_304613 [Podospora appendiculata]|uniref:Ubiquitin 3 binding protein But2 C-terminal domain-containing protein n=1 Tax=Podospora appendiculata TaxID=314037 RepID=A0AAE0WZK7_9PEZI|nr:hypothetical protein B0T22DRAFT_304613 [Podospora appendiculata]